MLIILWSHYSPERKKRKKNWVRFISRQWCLFLNFCSSVARKGKVEIKHKLSGRFYFELKPHSGRSFVDFYFSFGYKRKPTKLRVTNNERKLTKFSEHLKCVNAFLPCLENRFVDYYRAVCGFYGSLTFSGSRQLMLSKFQQNLLKSIFDSFTTTRT